MRFRKYIEPEKGHIRLTEWLKTIKSLENLREAQTDNPHEWVGYIVNTMSKTGQFHQRPERKYDCDLFFKEENKWKRVFYWHFVEEETLGVITFEGAFENKKIEETARDISNLLGAVIKNEETTKYD